MKTFVINLVASPKRKIYMEELLSLYPFLSVDFIEAVDGRIIHDKEIEKYFNQSEAKKKYGRFLRKGEIGCTLSHRKCAKRMLEGGYPYALILEDDVVFTRDLGGIISDLEATMKTDDPLIILLSGDYWYYRKQDITKDYMLAEIYEAVCSQAYLINRAAAKIIMELSPSYLADDWKWMKKKGISIKAVFPHVTDQNRTNFSTDISTAYEGTVRGNLSFMNCMGSYARAVIKRVLMYSGHFESKSFK